MRFLGDENESWYCYRDDEVFVAKDQKWVSTPPAGEGNATSSEPRPIGSKFRKKIFVVVLLFSYGVNFFVIGFNRVISLFESDLTIGNAREISSLVAVVALCVWYVWGYPWYKWKGGSRVGRGTIDESKKRSLLVPVVLYAFAFLSNDVSLIFVVLLTIIFVEWYSPSCFGFSFRKAPRLLGLGALLMAVSLLPVLFGLALRYGTVFLSVFSFMGFDMANLPLTLLYSIFVIGIAEEGLYRGYVQTKLSRVIGNRKAVLLQAVLFAAWHFDRRYPVEYQIFRLLEVFFFGFLVGTYYWQTRSLIGTALYHGLWDTFVLNERGLPAILFNMPISEIATDLMTGKAFVLFNSLMASFPFVVGISSVAAVVVMCVFSRRVCAVLGVLPD